MSKRKDRGKSDYEELYRLELEELNMPYTDEEIELHLHHREWKSVMEMIHAHNWQLIMLCLDWRDYLNGKTKRPVKKISKYVNPSQSADINNACFFIRSLVDLMCRYGEGSCPQARINTYCSRSTTTLIEQLGILQHSKHLTRAECASSKIFKYATYIGEPTMSKEKFRNTLLDLEKTFVDECTANAEELAEYTAKAVSEIEGEKAARIYSLNCHPITREEARSLISADGDKTRAKQDAALVSLAETRKMVKRMDNREKNALHKRKYRYTDDQLNAIHSLWLRAQKDPNVKSGSAHKASLEAAVEYYKKEFNALGVHAADDLRKALKSWSKRFK